MIGWYLFFIVLSIVGGTFFYFGKKEGFSKFDTERTGRALIMFLMGMIFLGLEIGFLITYAIWKLFT